MSDNIFASGEELAAWNEYAGGNETMDSYRYDLSSGSDGLHPTSVRAFHAAWLSASSIRWQAGYEAGTEHGAAFERGMMQ